MPADQRVSKHLWIALTLAISACGGAPLNQAKFAEVQGALHAAETIGAEQDPKAKQSLDLARKEAAEAKKLGDQGDGDKGNLHLERAQADADLASQLMRTRSEEEKAREAKSKLEAPTQAPQ